MSGGRGLLKTGFIAGLGLLLGIGYIAPASAHEIRTICDWDGDRCFRAICDDDGDDCRPIRERYADRVWVCDEDGDDCHWAYPAYGPPPPVYGYGPPVPFLGFEWHN